MIRRLLGIAMVVALLPLAGCSSDNSATTTGTVQETTTAASTATSGTESETTDTQASISLPDGWTINEAISAEEVGAITGENMAFFPEGASAADKGHPVGSYLVTDKEGSKIRFEALVDGGREGFEKIKGFAATETISEVSGLADEAFVCEFSPTNHGIVVLKGDLVARIDWNPTVYAMHKTEFGTKLAERFLANLFK